MRRMIPQAADQQGMPVYSYHQKIAMSSLGALHDCLYFVPFDEFRRQRDTLLTGGCLCLVLKLSIIVSRLLPQQRSPARDFGVDIATICRQLFLYGDGSQFGVQALGEMDAGE